MNVADIMNTNPVRISRDASIRDAAMLVADSQSSDLVVVGPNDEFVGVLSEGDLLRAIIPNYDDIARSGAIHGAVELFLANGKSAANRAISSLVISEPLTLAPSDPLLRAAALMIAKQIRRLPVVDRGRLVGTLSRADICRAVLNA